MNSLGAATVFTLAGSPYRGNARSAGMPELLASVEDCAVGGAQQTLDRTLP